MQKVLNYESCYAWYYLQLKGQLKPNLNMFRINAVILVCYLCGNFRMEIFII